MNLKLIQVIKKRWIYQLFFLLLAAAATINHYLLKEGIGLSWFSDAFFHYVCPICGITTLYQFILSSTSWINKLQTSTFWIPSIVLFSALFLGPLFCGWICPFGGYQDFLSNIGKKIFKKKYNQFLQSEIDRYFRWFRYIVLLWVIYMTASSAVKVLETINPYHSLLNLLIAEFVFEGLFILTILTASSIFIQRPWCKYFCPYGALLGISNRFRFFSIRRNSDTCVNCKKCDNTCPMNIKISDNQIVKSVQCISCMDCTSTHVCPAQNTVLFNNKKKEDEPMNEKVKTLGIVGGMMAAVIGTTFIAAHQPIQQTSQQLGSSDNVYENPKDEFNHTDGFKRKGRHNRGEERTIDGITLAEGTYKDGVYTAEGVGYEPGLKVQVAIEQNKIKDIKVISHNETPGFFERAFELIPAEIIDKQSTDVDTVSGATMSSYGIMEAVNKTLTQAKE